MRAARRGGSAGEAAYGLAQAVRHGDTVYVSGQTASRDDGGVDGVGDLPTQIRVAYTKIAALLASFGGGLGDVVDETIFVTDMDAMIAGGIEPRRAAYREALGEDLDIASTLVEVGRLAGADLLVEIKCTARLASGAAPTAPAAPGERG